MQSRCTALRAWWLRAATVRSTAALSGVDCVPRRYSALFAEGRFFVCSGCADAVSCLTCLVRNWNAPATCASCTSSYLGSRAHLDGRTTALGGALWQKVCLADVWLPAPFSRRRTRGSVALNGIEEEPALKLTQIVIRLPCARPSRQTHPRELPEDILGRRRATTHQRLPRWCGNAAQTS